MVQKVAYITQNSHLYLTGTGGIIMAAPSHYDARKPIDVQYSHIDKKSDLKNMMLNSGVVMDE